MRHDGPDRLGACALSLAQAGLVKLMDDFMVILLADDRMLPFFEKVDQVRVKAMLVEQFCEILNGGCVYSGKDMVAARAGMNVRKGGFYALVEDLQNAMAANGVVCVPEQAARRAGPQHRDIITK